MAMTPKQINATFPPIMSSTMLMKALGVSGRKLRWILQQGYITHTHDKRKTHCYRIAREDVIAYLKDSKAHPKKYPIPAGCFSSRGNTIAAKAESVEITQEPALLQGYLRQRWSSKPQLLPLQQAAELLGYKKSTLLGWRNEGLLECISVAGKTWVAKEELIHCLALPKMQTRAGHSVKHTKLQADALAWQDVQ